MSAISALTRMVKDSIEHEKRLTYFLKLDGIWDLLCNWLVIFNTRYVVGDEFIIDEDVLTFEPELAPPPPIPTELTCMFRFT